MNPASMHSNKDECACEKDTELLTKLNSCFSPSMTQHDAHIEEDRNDETERREYTSSLRYKGNKGDTVNQKAVISNLIDGVERGLGSILQTIFLNENEIDHKTLANEVDISEFKQLSIDEQTLALEEAKKIQQMNSWDTYECNSPISMASLASNFSNYQAITGTTYHKSPRENNKMRSKTVQFDYPVVTSMKQFPRLSQKEIKNLFFSVEELKQSEKEFEKFEEELKENVGIEIILSSSTDSQTDCSDGNEDDLSSCNSSIDSRLSGHDVFTQDENMMCDDIFKNESNTTKLDKIKVLSVEVNHQDKNKSMDSSAIVDNDQSNTEQEFWIPVD